jgi:predicted RNase H-like HicB family nuclease
MENYSVLLTWSKDDNCWLAKVGQLPGCIADGETRQEAVKNAEIAIQHWIETAKETGREIP